MPSDACVTIEIYNISGNLARTLYAGEAHKGDHSFIWNGLDDFGKQLPSGKYLVRVATNVEISIIKAVLLK